uniref:Uncharacterized protein n=1 Tax=Aegilops tauschii subsp. strangulata TaxID=200361 RepID=A0A453KMD3_AEGTS
MLVSIIFTCHSQKEQAHSILRMAHKTKRCSRGRWQTLITARHPLATDGLNNTMLFDFFLDPCFLSPVPSLPHESSLIYANLWHLILQWNSLFPWQAVVM